MQKAKSNAVVKIRQLSEGEFEVIADGHGDARVLAELFANDLRKLAQSTESLYSRVRPQDGEE